ncbi:MAG: hypothetical protein WKI04_09465, partial [Ferruginibacter sp.]
KSGGNSTNFSIAVLPSPVVITSIPYKQPLMYFFGMPGQHIKDPGSLPHIYPGNHFSKFNFVIQQ